tara:strand:+ start:953 stop:1309 length:357 start_codon:yes stop_codon:yes gene_type:complete
MPRTRSSYVSPVSTRRRVIPGAPRRRRPRRGPIDRMSRGDIDPQGDDLSYMRNRYGDIRRDLSLQFDGTTTSPNSIVDIFGGRRKSRRKRRKSRRGRKSRRRRKSRRGRKSRRRRRRR